MPRSAAARSAAAPAASSPAAKKQKAAAAPAPSVASQKKKKKKKKKQASPSQKVPRAVAELNTHGAQFKGTLSRKGGGPRHRTEMSYDEVALGRDAEEEERAETSTAPAGAETSNDAPVPVGRRVRVYWHGKKQWYAGAVTAATGRDFLVEYEDHGEHHENLASVQWEYEAAAQLVQQGAG